MNVTTAFGILLCPFCDSDLCTCVRIPTRKAGHAAPNAPLMAECPFCDHLECVCSTEQQPPSYWPEELNADLDGAEPQEPECPAWVGEWLREAEAFSTPEHEGEPAGA